jgi:YggT family protein
MDPFCHVYGAIYYILNVYLLVMLVYALISWVPSLRGRWTDVVARLVEPVLIPVRRIIPPLGGFDLSFLVVILIIQWVNNSIVARYACPVF